MKISENDIIKSIQQQNNIKKSDVKNIIIENYDEVTQKINENISKINDFEKSITSLYKVFQNEFLMQIENSKKIIEEKINNLINDKIIQLNEESQNSINELNNNLSNELNLIVNDIYSTISTKISNLNTFINTLETSYKEIKNDIENFNNKLNENHNQILENFKNNANNLFDISESVKNNIEKSKELSELLTNSEKNKIIKYLTAEISKNITNQFKSIIEDSNQIKNDFKDIQIKLLENINYIHKDEKELLEKVINDVTIFNKNIEIKSNLIVEKFNNILKNKIQSTFTNIKDKFSIEIKKSNIENKKIILEFFDKIENSIETKIKNIIKEEIKIPQLVENINVNTKFNEEFVNKQIEKILTTKLTKINLNNVIKKEIQNQLKNTKNILSENQNFKQIIQEFISKENILPQYQVKNNKIYIYNSAKNIWDPWLDLNTILLNIKKTEEFGGSGIGLYELHEDLFENNFKPIDFTVIDTKKVKKITFDDNYFIYDLHDDGTLYIKPDLPNDLKNNNITENFILNDNQHIITVSYNITIGSEIVKLNGIILSRGENKDYIIEDNKVILNSEYEIDSGDILEITYLKNYN